MILRDRRHVVWPGINFSWQAQYFTQVEWTKMQNALVRGSQRCTQLSILEGSLAELLRFGGCQVQKLKTSRRIVSFWTLLCSNTKKVSQNCFVSDVVKFKKWRRLAELFCFGRCYAQTLRKSRRIASFRMLSSSISQICFVLDFVMLKH